MIGITMELINYLKNGGGKEEVQVKRIARLGTNADKVAKKSATGSEANKAGF